MFRYKIQSFDIWHMRWKLFYYSLHIMYVLSDIGLVMYGLMIIFVRSTSFPSCNSRLIVCSTLDQYSFKNRILLSVWENYIFKVFWKRKICPCVVCHGRVHAIWTAMGIQYGTYGYMWADKCAFAYTQANMYTPHVWGTTVGKILATGRRRKRKFRLRCDWTAHCNINIAVYLLACRVFVHRLDDSSIWFLSLSLSFPARSRIDQVDTENSMFMRLLPSKSLKSLPVYVYAQAAFMRFVNRTGE